MDIIQLPNKGYAEYHIRSGDYKRKAYYSADGLMHRLEGPALQTWFEGFDGYKEVEENYYYHGKLLSKEILNKLLEWYNKEKLNPEDRLVGNILLKRKLEIGF